MDPDEGPVYYREIQKNAYLKRIPNDTGNKLLPLGNKKPPLKPMWTLFCIHNGKWPYLEQYPTAECPSVSAHRPVWRASLLTARHVTCSARPLAGSQHDFLVATAQGPVRMLAPDWDSMQDWVTTLRNKLSELRILSKGENVYCAAPSAPVPRAAARDPTSPLPPTPPVPPDRVPGIELTTPVSRATPPEEPQSLTEQELPTAQEVDISSWDETPLPSTSSAGSSQEKQEPKKSVAKICGQNICLDDSILKRSLDTDSDEEFPNEMDAVADAVEDLQLYKQTVLVEDGRREETSASDRQTNITVIQVMNKPPHTAIPVIGPETEVFDFSFAQTGRDAESFVNIVNTEVNVNSENGYGTVFADTDYGHLSLATTVNLTAVNVTDVNVSDVSVTSVNGAKESGDYERLCLASTSNDAIAKVKRTERVRKSSLPNMPESTYECLFPSQDRVNRSIVNESIDSRTSAVRVGANVESIDSRTSAVRMGANVESIDSRTSAVRGGGANVESIDSRTSAVRGVNSVRPSVNSVERSYSQNACDVRRDVCRRQTGSPKREKSERVESGAKPIWRRGLTELSLLTRLRGIAQRRASPHEADHERNGTSPVKVVHRSRAEGRGDVTRRRSSSLTNGQSPPPSASCALIPLRRRQALGLQAEQRRRAAIPATVPTHSAPVLAEYEKRVW